ncbi:translation initiation factor 2 [Xanthobacteraceae bacterium Astr-EGSB]|uniref:translation initiation factor 2 n=1 Tax=Astrobacterium formosum TaxID=3069710 RepID=UPI0027B2E133|nr:translation initiation factor 2 [Xanthobacteraceae bacterium Astr-EGSB]
MRILLIVAAAAALSGCASVTRGWNEQMNFDSVPSGAEVRVAAEPVCPPGGCTTDVGEIGTYSQGETPPSQPNLGCVTPCVLQVKRNDVLIATFTKPGYQPHTIRVDTRVAGAGAAGMAGNILLGGVVGMAVDAASGATLEHFPNPAVAHLTPVPAPPPPRAPPRIGKPKRPTS